MIKVLSILSINQKYRNYKVFKGRKIYLPINSTIFTYLASKRPASAALMKTASYSSDVERPVRAEFGGKVRMGFLPDEW